MTEWKRRQIERRRLEEEFAKVAHQEFVKFLVAESQKSINSKKDIQEAAKVCCEAAWRMARTMVEARAE